MATSIDDDPANDDVIVHVVDDHEDARETLRDQLRSVGLKVKTYEDGEVFLSSFDPTSYACVVLDLRMPKVGGLAVLEEIRRKESQVPAIILSAHVDVSTAVKAMKKGCVDVIEKGGSQEQFVETVQAAVKRETLRRQADQASFSIERRREGLTPREREVMRLVVAGKRNKEIAFDLGIGVGTVEIHRGRIMRKMGAESVAELIKMIMKSEN